MKCVLLPFPVLPFLFLSPVSDMKLFGCFIRTVNGGLRVVTSLFFFSFRLIRLLFGALYVDSSSSFLLVLFLIPFVLEKSSFCFFPPGSAPSMTRFFGPRGLCLGPFSSAEESTFFDSTKRTPPRREFYSSSFRTPFFSIHSRLPHPRELPRRSSGDFPLLPLARLKAR